MDYDDSAVRDHYETEQTDSHYADYFAELARKEREDKL